MRRAREAAPQSPRPLLLAGQRQARAGQHEAALATWDELRLRDAASFRLVALEYADSALAAGRAEAAHQTLLQAHAQAPSLDLLRAVAQLARRDLATLPQTLNLLREQPTLSAAQAVLARPLAEWTADSAAAVAEAVNRAAKPQQRYRCAACGFEAQRYFWQCPGCLSWDSFPAQRVEEQ